MNKYPLWDVIDIETCPVPPLAALPFAPDFNAPSNYKDPVKIAEYKKLAESEWLESSALRSTTGRICAVGWMDEQGGQRIYCKGPEFEREMIAVLWSHLFTAEDSRVFV